MELKSLPFAVKSISDRTIVGICAVFGNVDSGGDRIWPGAFTKTISERRLKFRHLWNHDFWNPPIATIDDIKEVTRDGLPQAVLSQAPEAVGGLEVTRTYLDTLRAEEVFVGLKAGAINEMSFGYDPIPGKMAITEEVNSNSYIRELYEVRLWDTSDVNWGMNEATAGVKGLPMGIPLEVLMHQLDMAMKAFKAGARHSAKDIENLNAIHSMIVDLGATKCKGIADEEEEQTEEDEKSRAAIALTLKRADDFLLDEKLQDFLSTFS